MYPLKKDGALPMTFFAHDINGDAITGLVDGDFTKRISKNGGAFGAMTVTITELENGWYAFTLSASHSDTNGVLSITFIASTIKQVNLQFRVSTNIYDDLHTLGAGATEWTYTLTSTVDPYPPIADADVWVTSDEAGNNVIASGQTDANGVVTFYLDDGSTIYIWSQKSGWDFDNPDTEVVS